MDMKTKLKENNAEKLLETTSEEIEEDSDDASLGFLDDD